MNVKAFINNLLLDLRGKDISFKSPPGDLLGRYKEKVQYWKECTYVMVGLAVISGTLWIPLAIPPALVAARKISLIYTKKSPEGDAKKAPKVEEKSNGQAPAEAITTTETKEGTGAT